MLRGSTTECYKQKCWILFAKKRWKIISTFCWKVLAVYNGKRQIRVKFFIPSPTRFNDILLVGGDEERMKDWIMYAEIQALKRLGFKRTRVAKKLKIHYYTVDKYWNMMPEEFTMQLEASKTRTKKPDKYREDILALLEEFPDMTASQLYDWLKERYPQSISFSERTMRSYITVLRIEEDIPKPRKIRQYEAMDDPPMGYQSQVDMGEIWLEDQNKKRVKLYCFAMVLAHSRYKFILWADKPFSTVSFIDAHNRAFEYLGGMPVEIV
jgi:transposase